MNPLLELLRRSPGAQAAPSADATAADSFFAQGSLPADCLSVEIDPLGPLPQPLPPALAQALHALSEPAHFGLREQTLLDTGVRHTGEVSADRLGLHWQSGAFAALQHDVARALGVERLDAWLHNLLIYGPGQFFKPHQDTERHPGMVATLVLVWPSPHIGGELRVRLGQEEGRLASQHLQTQALRWFAFYADCRHEVLPVEEGWRVVLSFDLVVPSQAATRPAIPTPLQKTVEAALREQFGLAGEAPRRSPWVLLLDHDYTEHGLRWPLLKGDDRWRVAALRTAAETLGLRVHLALAELHETWSTQPVLRSRTGRNGREYDEPTDEVEADELVDEAVSLDFWVDAQDRVGPHRSLAIRRDDMACLVETGEAHLVDEQYEGYMGNYGETLDYWYRRAALVIRTPLADERDRFELDFDAALDDARQLARDSARDPAQAAALAMRVESAAQTLAWRAGQQDRGLLEAYAEIAAALPEDAATALLQPFVPSGFEASDAEVLARLGQQRGTTWLRGLLRHWHAPGDRRWGSFATWQPGWRISFQGMPRLWPQPLPAFIGAALQAGWPDDLLDEWFQGGLVLLERFVQASAGMTPANRLNLQAELLQAVGELAQALVLCIEDEAEPGARHLQALIHQILVHPQLYPLPLLRPLVEAMGTGSTRWPAQAPLRTQVVTALRDALAQAERAPDDHGLRGISWTCRCNDCAGLIAWAESPAAQPLVMAMAEPRRRHVEEKFAESGAPLTATTLRQGSPHKLVLGKPADLLARDQAQCEGWVRDLAALERL